MTEIYDELIARHDRDHAAWEAHYAAQFRFQIEVQESIRQLTEQGIAEDA